MRTQDLKTAQELVRRRSGLIIFRGNVMDSSPGGLSITTALGGQNLPDIHGEMRDQFLEWIDVYITKIELSLAAIGITELDDPEKP